jgi:putative peptidoglycan lipid II flippase
MVPALFGTSVVQINLLFDTLIASFLAAGSISWLYFSDRFVELPLALFGVAIGTVILPRLSRQHSRDTPQGFSETMDWALRLALIIAVPAMVGLVMLAGPILVTLIQYRAFSFSDTQMARLSLMAYAVGLPAFILIKVLAPGFYSRQDTRTPVRIGIIAMLANMGLNVSFVVPWFLLGIPGPHAGLALATSLSACLNAGLLFRRLRGQGTFRSSPGWSGLSRRIAVAATVMGGVLWSTSPALAEWSAWLAWERGLVLGALITLGAGTYVATLYALGIRPRHLLLRQAE